MSPQAHRSVFLAQVALNRAFQPLGFSALQFLVERVPVYKSVLENIRVIRISRKEVWPTVVPTMNFRYLHCPSLTGPLI